MLPIIWRDSARADLAEIIRYIADEAPQAARQLKNYLEAASYHWPLTPICIVPAVFRGLASWSPIPTMFWSTGWRPSA